MKNVTTSLRVILSATLSVICVTAHSQECFDSTVAIGHPYSYR